MTDLLGLGGDDPQPGHEERQRDADRDPPAAGQPPEPPWLSRVRRVCQQTLERMHRDHEHEQQVGINAERHEKTVQPPVRPRVAAQRARQRRTGGDQQQ